MKSVRIVLCVLSLAVAGLGQEYASDCPEPNGFFADAVQCDKYYACVDNVLSEKLCPDGMVFNDLNPRIEKCDFPFHTSCEGRPELQIAQPTKHCPRQNGYFPHEDAAICNQFYFCAGGTGSQITCPEGLAFSLKTGTCVWPDEAGRTDCTSKDVLNFTCPREPFEVAVAHPRYADPDDCQYFYVCINGDTPRRNGCNFGEVFNTETTACDQPRNVPDCKDYYKEYFEQYFAGLESGGQVNAPDILAAAVASGFELPTKPKRVKINPGAQRASVPAQDSAAVPAEPPRASRPRPKPQTTRAEEAAAQPAPAAAPASRPSSRDRLRTVQRRRPGRITTTTTAAPVADYDYYYYENGAEKTAPAAPPAP